jgi:tyrosyl-tRNA synthetase
MLSKDEIIANAQGIEDQVRKLMPKDRVWFTQNSNWFRNINFLDFIQDIGSHFSVNTMLRAECFKSRLDQGLSFLEFSYMLMQGFDFFQLNELFRCTLQIGGDDQWSNMLAGIDLIHKKTGREAFALTLPLLTNTDGSKMGKTERGAIWLKEDGATSIVDFFQFWRNLPDTEVLNCFRLLTFLSLEEIAAIPFTEVSDINAAKKRLAFEMTKLVHGLVAAEVTLEVAEALFESQDVSVLEPLSIADNMHVLDMLKECGFAKSRTDARNLIGNRGITINEEVLTDPTLVISKAQFGFQLTVCKGKKHFRLLHINKEPNAAT